MPTAAATMASARMYATMASARMYAEGLSSTSCSVGIFARGASSLNMGAHGRRRSLHVVCHSEPAGGCCGGSGSDSSSSTSTSSGNGSSCSSHGKNSLANLGKEFEHLVATNTLTEFEENYVSAPMEGKITRDIMGSVMETNPDETTSEEEKFLDINEILREAKNMSNGDLIFSENSDFVIV